jgi:hypothetical protein
MDVSYEPRPGVLHVVARGRFDAREARAIIGEVARLCAQHRLGRVLVDFRAVVDPISIAERHALGNALASAAIPARIAIVVDEPHHRTKAFEDTAVNRGAAVLTTTSEEQARSFLGIGA